VHDLAGWMAYLAKPADGRLCRPGPLTPWTPDPYARARNYRAALDEYAAARCAALAQGKRRLSPLSGWVNTRSKRTQPHPLLVLRIACYLLGLVFLISRNPAPLPGLPSISERPLPRLPVRPQRHIQAHPPPRIGQVQTQ
jgi:hypothetical protein